MRPGWRVDPLWGSRRERDPEFRDELTRVARSGMRAAAILGMLAVALFVGTNALIGKQLTLAYGGPGLAVVLWDKLLLVAVCIVALMISARLDLAGVRLLSGFLVLLCGAASVLDDLAAGDISFSPGYLILIYLVATAVIPYRPGQTALLGAGMSAVLYGAITHGPALLGAPTIDLVKSHFVYTSVMTLLATGISWIIYDNRYRQHQARFEAEHLRNRLEEIERIKNRFFLNLSHELRTPLTLLRGPIEDVLEGRNKELQAALGSRAQDMKVQVDRLRRLIDQLLDLSRLEAGRFDLNLQSHDLVSVVRREVGLFRAHAEAKGVELHFQPSVPRVICSVDAEQFQKVIANLLSNAFKSTARGGMIRVRVFLDESGGRPEVVLSVRDTGRGIASSLLPVIFDRFESGGSVDGEAGTGIGLAFVKEVIEHHQGTVGVASEPGFGAEFVVRLPAHAEPDAGGDRLAAHTSADAERLEASSVNRRDALVLETPPIPISQEHDDHRPLVLVVEDEWAVQRYLMELLSPRYRVDAAGDGAAALELVNSLRPDLVVSDVSMDRLDGLALCRAVRADAALAATPIVLLTARGDERERLEGLTAGADAYITKPFSSSELLITVENLIEVRRLLRDHVPMPEWMQTRSPNLPSPDAAFLGRVKEVIEAGMGDRDFGVEWLAGEVGLSSRQLQRRMQALTRLTAAGFIKAMRLEQAALLLRSGDLQIGEVARAVGYEDPNYFSQLFRQTYGMPPSDYARMTARQRSTA